MNERFYKIEDNPNLVKDSETGAVINSNASALEAYKKQRAHLNKINTVEDRIGKLEDNMSEIKDLLKELLGKN
jgi:hypothetical protein